MNPLSDSIKAHYERHGPVCPGTFFEITNLDEYLEVLGGQEGKWFRGHSSLNYAVTPSALRFGSPAKRRTALGLFREMRRHAAGKMERVESLSVDCEWMQRAQHYGLPTRLLDWTEQPAVGLFFACCSPNNDGLVLLLNPDSLNKMSGTGHDTSIRPEQFPDLVEPYAQLGETTDRNGLATIAIKPMFNNDRIRAQAGTFTLHGSRQFRLSSRVAPSLVYIPILQKHKRRLLDGLNAMGVNEMALFPELEKLCNHIRRTAGL